MAWFSNLCPGPPAEIVLLEPTPAGIRRKSTAEFLRQPAQGRDHVLHPAGSRIIQRAAAEWRIAGAKDHRAIDHVGIVDDAFAQTRDADVRDRQDPPGDHFVRRVPSGRGTGGFVWLAVP